MAIAHTRSRSSTSLFSTGWDNMPVRKGKSDKVIGENIQELTAAGKPRKQAIAIALGAAGYGKPKKPKKKPKGK